MKKILLAAIVFIFSLNLQNAEATMKSTYEEAVFAGGCFWCIESDFEKLEGIVFVRSGYIGGTAETANYKQVSSGVTDHFEAIVIKYDTDYIQYEELLEYFWRHVDPLDGGGQFCDRGDQYLSAVFYKDEKQKELIEKSKVNVEKILGSEVKTVIAKESPFYEAEDYHQNYYKRNPIRYKYYRHGCGRDKRVKDLWSK